MALDRDRAQVYRDQSDRDRELESRYRLWCNGDTKTWEDKPCCSSLLQHVMTHMDALLAEYMQWVNNSHEAHAFDQDALYRWEVERFGDRAYPAAHAALLFGVKVAVFGDVYKNLRRREDRQPKVKPGLSDSERVERMLVAVDKLAEGRSL